MERLPIVEHICGYSYCKHHPTYDRLATCYNCGEKHIARITWGHSHFTRDCPHCGVSSRINYGTSQQAADALAAQGGIEEVTEHVWQLISAHGEDAPGQSRDTYEMCVVCGALKHDYRHGGGLTSPNYPVYSFVAVGGSPSINHQDVPPCARGAISSRGAVIDRGTWLPPAAQEGQKG